MYLYRKNISKNTKIEDFGLRKPSQNPPKIDLKSMFPKICTFSTHFWHFFFFLISSTSWKYAFYLGKITIFKVLAKIILLQFSYIFLQKIVKKSFEHEARARKKLMPKTHPFLISTFLCSCIDFGRSWASELEPNWPCWAPRTLPKASRTQSFGSMCPKWLPRGSKVLPKGVPRSP